MVIRLTRYYGYPKAVNVEVNFVDKIPFPKVTICNSNFFKSSSLAESGLYDVIQDTLVNPNDHYENSDDQKSDCFYDILYIFIRYVLSIRI